MSNTPKLDPAEALDRLFAVIKEEALESPVFARRILTAMGIQVAFTGSDGAAAADPILVAATNHYTAFREMFATFSEKELQALIKAFGLATAEDLKGVKRPKKDKLIELMWVGAKRRLADRRMR